MPRSGGGLRNASRPRTPAAALRVNLRPTNSRHYNPLLSATVPAAFLYGQLLRESPHGHPSSDLGQAKGYSGTIRRTPGTEWRCRRGARRSPCKGGVSRDAASHSEGRSAKKQTASPERATSARNPSTAWWETGQRENPACGGE